MKKTNAMVLGFALISLAGCGGAAPPGMKADLAKENQLSNTSSNSGGNEKKWDAHWLTLDEKAFDRIEGHSDDQKDIFDAITAEPNEKLDTFLALNPKLDPKKLVGKTLGRVICFEYEGKYDCAIQKVDAEKSEEKAAAAELDRDTYNGLKVDEISPESGKVKIKAVGYLSCMKILAEKEEDSTYECGDVSTN